jgi:steroid 5-alpha reductase family enzyme
VIAEAIDAAWTIGAALLAWIAVAAAVATIGLITLAVTGVWAWKAARRALTGAQTAPDAEDARFPNLPPARRHTPAWARTQSHDLDEAA